MKKRISLVLATLLLVASLGSSVFAGVGMTSDYSTTYVPDMITTGSSTVTVTWSEVTGADEYVVTMDGQPSQTVRGALSATFANLTPGESYNYGVEAWMDATPEITVSATYEFDGRYEMYEKLRNWYETSNTSDGFEQYQTWWQLDNKNAVVVGTEVVSNGTKNFPKYFLYSKTNPAVPAAMLVSVSGTAIAAPIETYTVSAVANIVGRGTVTVAGSPVIKAHELTVTAVAATNHFFKKFIDAETGATVSTSAIYTFIPTADTDLIAVFDTDPGTEDPYAPGPGTDVGNDGGEQGGTEEAGDDELPSTTPEQAPADDEQVPVEVVDDGSEAGDDEDVTDGDLPAGTPEMPQTSGIPMGILLLAGSSLTGLGLKLKKSNK